MRIFIYLSALLLVASCDLQPSIPRTDHTISQSDTLSIKSLLNDSTKTMVAVFPLYFDSTSVLIQPSGLIGRHDLKSNFDSYNLSFAKNNKSKSDNNQDASPDFYVGNINSDALTGRMSNLYFDDLKTNTQRLLTNIALNINEVRYLREIAKKTNKDYLLYFVNDRDTNHDNILDKRDFESLYISKLNGEGFEKLTDENHQFSSGKLMPLFKRYYYTTIENVNEDPNSDAGDKYHYYYIDFSGNSYDVVEYNPLSK